MRIHYTLFLLILTSINFIYGQNKSDFNTVSELTWELDYEIFLKLENDSDYRFDIRQLFHVKPDNRNFSTDYVYYPVNPGQEYINRVNTINENEDSYKETYTTLWSALHDILGGGWVHFTNCLMYALETGYLDLTAPLMKRPDSKWKPRPVTESFKRTKKWNYYIPVNQRYAKKEYKLKKANNSLHELSSIPDQYINLFLNTSNRKYKEMKENGPSAKTAKIDLIKILLGANYLSEAQILYIRSTVLNAVQNYSVNKLPSVIIFDEFDAAALMSLDTDGYKIEKVAFRSSSGLDEIEVHKRKEQLQQIVNKINQYNKNSFQGRLEKYYQ